jgi:uncharacterized repeat protein (TIGR03803 family)
MRRFNRSITLSILFVLTALVSTSLVEAQTFSVLHSFNGGSDGADPVAGLTIDAAGNLYGTAEGGSDNYGTVYKVTHKSGGWVFTPLYTFAGGNDGVDPEARVIFGPGNVLYGTTVYGGTGECNGGCGTVFMMRPATHACKTALCPWTETVLYSFMGGSDGLNPLYGDVAFDKSGNIYGTTQRGGASGNGTVYELTPSASGWTKATLYDFTGGTDGALPYSGVILDLAGNLYGTTSGGGHNNCNGGCGTVYQLTPSESGWTENTLYAFQGESDGGQPEGGLIFDESGNLYGTTYYYGGSQYGTVYELVASNGIWALTTLYSFTGGIAQPRSSLIMDGVGSLYGTSESGGFYGCGTVFKLTPSGSGWTYTSLHDFSCGGDGAAPYGNVTLDANGNIYGTAAGGGAYGNGVVWEITP